MGTIVVGTDGSETARRALDSALQLAHELGDSLVLVTAWRELHGDFGLPLDTLVPSLELADIEREWAERTVADAASTAEEAGVHAVTVCERGDPAATICQAARTHGARLIVVGAHGWGPIEGLLFGSVSRGVLGSAPCPVLVIPESWVGRDADQRRRNSSSAIGNAAARTA